MLLPEATAPLNPRMQAQVPGLSRRVPEARGRAVPVQSRYAHFLDGATGGQKPKSVQGDDHSGAGIRQNGGLKTRDANHCYDQNDGLEAEDDRDVLLGQSNADAIVRAVIAFPLVRRSQPKV